MNDRRVSILILTLNGQRTLPALLEGLARQRVSFPIEIVAVDSGSSDRTRELLGPHVQRLLGVPEQTFNHGGTRNLGIAACHGELVVLIVQDAVPVGETWLAGLVQPLWEDARLAGSYARQVPRPQASAVARYYQSLGPAASEEPRTSEPLAPGELEALPPAERLFRCSFDNVCSCIRRSVWERHPFPEIDIAEDVAWAKEVLEAGYRLAYVPAAAVVHSHDRSARYELLRTYFIHRQLRLLLGLRTLPNPLHLVRAVAASLVAHVRCLLGEGRAIVARPREIARVLALAFAFPLGQYLGPVAADRGFRLRKPRGL